MTDRFYRVPGKGEYCDTHHLLKDKDGRCSLCALRNVDPKRVKKAGDGEAFAERLRKQRELAAESPELADVDSWTGLDN